MKKGRNQNQLKRISKLLSLASRQTGFVDGSVEGNVRGGIRVFRL